MTKVLLTIFLSIITLVTNAQLTNGLVAHWNFNGNANDVTGNGYNGIASNVTYGTGSMGSPNTAAIFNGTNSYINVAYQSGLNLSNFSICAIVKVNGYYNGTCQSNMIFQRSTEHQAGHYSLLFCDNPYDNVNCSHLDTSKEVFYSGISNKATLVNQSGWQYTPTIVSGNWYCVVSTYDGVRNNIYVNGVLKSSVLQPAGAIGTSTEGVSIGASRFGPYTQYPYWLNGKIDDLRLYNRALSASEVISFCSIFDTLVLIKDNPNLKGLCSDDTFHLAYTVSDTFNAGNVFTAQLSNASGSFANPVNIGSLTATTDGKIICNIPSIAISGNGYRARIVSSNPLRISDVSSPLSLYPILTPSVTITVNPSGPFAANQFITFKALPVDAGAAPLFQWMRNGQAITGANADSLYINTLNDGDSISVMVMSSNPCPPDLVVESNKIGVNITESVNDIRLDNLALYPNPNNGTFSISATNVRYGNINIELLNAVGQVVFRENITPQNNTINHPIKLNNTAAGVYLLHISADGKQRNLRLVINK